MSCHLLTPLCSSFTCKKTVINTTVSYLQSNDAINQDNLCLKSSIISPSILPTLPWASNWCLSLCQHEHQFLSWSQPHHQPPLWHQSCCSSWSQSMIYHWCQSWRPLQEHINQLSWSILAWFYAMKTYLAFCLTGSLSFASLSWMPFSSWLSATSTVSFNQLSTTGQRDEAYSWIKNSTAAIKWWSIGWSSSLICCQQNGKVQTRQQRCTLTM